MDFAYKLQQRQQISHAQVQAMKVLAMDSMELKKFLNDEYLENPLLEHSETVSITVSEPLDAYSQELPAPHENNIREYLLSQLNPKLYSSEEWNLFQYMIDCLDDNGFFAIPAEEVAQKTGASKTAAARCLTVLRTLEPCGIFAPNLQECLLRQTETLGLQRDILNRIIRYHLQDIADGKLSSISRKLHISAAEVHRFLEILRHLNPRPLAGFGTANSSYIIPDIILSRENNQWRIQLNDDWIENYSLNDYFLKMMNTTHDPELAAYFKDKLTRARLIMNSIQQRRQTILKITGIILEIQNDFFEFGHSLVPMTMSDVAQRAGIHVSTVSRAVKGKYLQYPRGSVLLKKLFAAAVSGSGQKGVTPMLIKQCISELVEAENKQKPYSDQVLADLLKQRDIQVSRRVVAKYRDELGIRSSFERQRHGE